MESDLVPVRFGDPVGLIEIPADVSYFYICMCLCFLGENYVGGICFISFGFNKASH